MIKREVNTLRHNKKTLERALLGFDGLGVNLVARIGQVDCCFTVSHLVAYALSKMGIEAYPVNCEVAFTNKHMREYSPTVRKFENDEEKEKFWKEAPDLAWSVGIGADEPDKDKIPLHTVIWLPDTCEIIDLTAFQATRNEKSLWVHPYWTSIFDLTKLRTAVNDNGEKIMTTGADIILPHQYEIKNGVDYDISPLVWFFPKEQTGKLWYKQFESVDEGETAVLLAACFLKICKATMQKEPSTKQILKWAEELVEMEEVITINPSHVKGVMEALNQVLLMGGFPHLPVKMMGGETLNNVNKARSAYGMPPL